MTEKEIKLKVYQEFVIACGWERAYAIGAKAPNAEDCILLEHRFREGVVYGLGDLICALWGVDTYVKWLEDVENEYGL